MRVKLSKIDRDKLFSSIFTKQRNWNRIAINQKVTARTLRDWRKGNLTIPETSFKDLLKISELKSKNLSLRFLPDHWHIAHASRKGAKRRMELYGNLGTPEGRKKGGIASLKTHNKINTGFVTLKEINIPQRNALLAEFLGILIGDGHLSKYQVEITTNSLTDLQHAKFIKKVLYDLFQVKSKITLRKNENSVSIVASSKKLVEVLNYYGMPMGNKIKKGLKVPPWISKKSQFKKHFIRGLFDTDGSVYVDRHTRKNKTYVHAGWTITSYADKLRQDIVHILEELGFSPTCRESQKSVYIRRQDDIRRYFKDIGSSNPKHIKRYREFVGGVPKWS